MWVPCVKTCVLTMWLSQGRPRRLVKGAPCRWDPQTQLLSHSALSRLFANWDVSLRPQPVRF